MLAFENSTNATPALKKKSKKGLALRDITNQTPQLKTVKKTAKKSVAAVKKVAEERKSINEKELGKNSLKTAPKKTNSVTKVSKSQMAKVSDIPKDHVLDDTIILQEIEYMPPNPIPIQFTNEKYKIDVSCLKATSKGCIFTKPNFKNYLNDEFKAEVINFNTETTLFVVEEADDSFLYF